MKNNLNVRDITQNGDLTSIIFIKEIIHAIIIDCVFLTNLYLNPHLHTIARSKLWPAKTCCRILDSLLRNSAKLGAIVEKYKQRMTRI